MLRITIVLSVLAVFVASTVVNQCGDGTPLPTEVRIPGCDAVPCDIIKGQNITMEADGHIPWDVDQLTLTVLVRLMGIEVDIPLDDPNGCNMLIDDECPIEAGTDVSVRTSIYIPDNVPSIEVELEVRVLDGLDQTIVCLTGPFVIV